MEFSKLNRFNNNKTVNLSEPLSFSILAEKKLNFSFLHFVIPVFFCCLIFVVVSLNKFLALKFSIFLD